MSSLIRGYVAILYLALCLMLGGASAAGAIANALLQVLAIIIILGLVWSRRLAMPAEARPLAWIVGLFLLFGLLTLVPLPAAVWQSLPYRNEIADGLRLIGIGDVSLPLSLAPAATIGSLLWLLPPTAMFLIAVSLPAEERRRLCATILVLAVLSMMLGVFQLAGGPESALRFYEITNQGDPVGFFANRNHQATLLLCGLPCIAFLASRLAGARHGRSRTSGGMIIMGASAFFVAIGIAIAGSMAGYGLFLAAAFASLLIYRRALAKKIDARWRIGTLVVLLLFVAGALAGPLSQETLSNKFSQSPSSRRTLTATTAQAIADSFPAGTGLGTFANVYRRYEDPQGATREYANHAHNDYVEFVLELGLAGLLLIAFFLTWWVRRSLLAWRSDLPGASMARVGSVIVGIVLLHSLVDYPLRTSAIAAVFAAACALLLPPPAARPGRDRANSEQGRQDARHIVAN